LDKVSSIFPTCLQPEQLTPRSFPAIGRQNITCSPVELVTLNPPSGHTCGQYMQNFIAFAGGYLTNPAATKGCEFCSVRTTDQFLESNFNIFYHNRWRDLGIMLAFIVFNVSVIYVISKWSGADEERQIISIFIFTYLFRIRTGSLLNILRKHPKRS